MLLPSTYPPKTSDLYSKAHGILLGEIQTRPTGIPGQKESGFVVTANLDSDTIQSDIIWNYYWLAAMSVFCPASLAPPAKFTTPGDHASPIFNKLLKMVTKKRLDTINDQLLFPSYGKSVELYSITQQGSKTYISADPSAVISMGFGPPPSPPRDKVGLGGGLEGGAHPTPWEGKDSSMLTREIQDGGQLQRFGDIWPTLSCVSNSMEFLYPYTPVYKTNPVPPEAWRVPSGTLAPNCGSKEYFTASKSKIGTACKSNTDCDSGNCQSGYCVFPGDTPCTNCAACGLPGDKTKSKVCNVHDTDWDTLPNQKPPGCYSVQLGQDVCNSVDNNNTCSDKCPCYTCSPFCPTLTTNDVGDICFGTKDGNFIPSNNCYNVNGKNYDCAARVPWAPGGLWIGGLMYKFWKDAGEEEDVNNRSVYVSMYSSFDDSGTGCILNCGGGIVEVNLLGIR